MIELLTQVGDAQVQAETMRRFDVAGGDAGRLPVDLKEAIVKAAGVRIGAGVAAATLRKRADEAEGARERRLYWLALANAQQLGEEGYVALLAGVAGNAANAHMADRLARAMAPRAGIARDAIERAQSEILYRSAFRQHRLPQVDAWLKPELSAAP